MPVLYAGTLYRNYFGENLDPGVSVKSDVPATRPPKLIVVTTVPAGGNAKPRYMAWRRVVVQWWASDDDTGGDLGEEIRDLVVDSPKALATVHKIEIVGEPGRFDDPMDTAPRFQMTFDVLLKRMSS